MLRWQIPRNLEDAAEFSELPTLHLLSQRKHVIFFTSTREATKTVQSPFEHLLIWNLQGVNPRGFTHTFGMRCGDGERTAQANCTRQADVRLHASLQGTLRGTLWKSNYGCGWTF